MKEDFLKEFNKDSNPYSVPEGYFEKKKMDLEAITEDVKPKVPVITLKNVVSWGTGIAAALALVVILYPSSPVNPTETTISEADIQSYLLEEYSAGPTEEGIILGELTAEDLEDISFNTLDDDDDLEEFIEQNFDQTLHYEYL